MKNIVILTKLGFSHWKRDSSFPLIFDVNQLATYFSENGNAYIGTDSVGVSSVCGRKVRSSACLFGRKERISATKRVCQSLQMTAKDKLSGRTAFAF